MLISFLILVYDIKHVFQTYSLLLWGSGGEIYTYVFNCLKQRPWFLCFELLTERNQLQMCFCSVIVPSQISDMTRSIHGDCSFAIVTKLTQWKPTIDAAVASMKTDTTATMTFSRDAGFVEALERDITQLPTCSAASQPQKVLLFRHHQCVKPSMPVADRGAVETQSRDGNRIFLVLLRPECV
jgi:hypothetical protein